MDKLVIGICNKELTLMKQMKKMIEDLLSIKKVNYEIVLYVSLKKLIEKVEKFQIIF